MVTRSLTARQGPAKRVARPIVAASCNVVLGAHGDAGRAISKFCLSSSGDLRTENLRVSEHLFFSDGPATSLTSAKIARSKFAVS